MREGARIFLAIWRDANAQQINIQPEFVSILRSRLGVTDAERNEIGEILKADIREKYINHPAFGAMNDFMNSLGETQRMP